MMFVSGYRHLAGMARIWYYSVNNYVKGKSVEMDAAMEARCRGWSTYDINKHFDCHMAVKNSNVNTPLMVFEMTMIDALQAAGIPILPRPELTEWLRNQTDFSEKK